MKFVLTLILVGLPLLAAKQSNPLDEDVVAYAEECKRELGITEPLPDLNCLNGKEIPITIDGNPVDEKNFSDLKSGKLGCDNAQWLEAECWTYDLVQRVETSNPDVEGVLNCRQKTYTNPFGPSERIRRYQAAVASGQPKQKQIELYRLIYEFDDLGLILRNKTTGKSCFFTFFGEFDAGETYYGGWIPAPDRKTIPSKKEIFEKLLPAVKPPQGYPEKNWNRGPKGYPRGRSYIKNMFFSPKETAEGSCVDCHNQGAFKHSPFIMQMKDEKGFIVPENPRDVPYLLVGPAFQKKFREHKHVEIDTAPISGDEQTCTSCHRMASGSLEILDWSLGKGTPRISTKTAKFPNRSWMPLDHGMDSQELFRENFGAHVDAIRCCAENPDALGCRKRKFGPTLEEIGLKLGEKLKETSWVYGANRKLKSCLPQ